MTTIDTKHLRALAEAATPGPWRSAITRQFAWVETVPEFDLHRFDIQAETVANVELKDEDAAYIAAIDPPTLIALLDELERLRCETEWEYECKIPSSDLAVEHDWTPVADRTHGMNCTGKMRRRRKAGPWELMEGETND